MPAGRKLPFKKASDKPAEGVIDRDLQPLPFAGFDGDPTPKSIVLTIGFIIKKASLLIVGIFFRLKIVQS